MEEKDTFEARTETHRYFIRNLRNEIARHKVEVADLAPRIGMSKSGLYKVLAGTVEPDTSLLERLGKVFSREPASFFGEPVAQRMPTIHEAFRVIEAKVDELAKLPNLSHVPQDILAWLATAGPEDLSAIRATLFGDAIGKEEVKSTQNKRAKSRHSG